MAENAPHSDSGEHSFVSPYILSFKEEERERYALLVLRVEHETDVLSIPHRLDMQSRYVTKFIYGGKIINAPTTLDPGDEVLESATGTGLRSLSHRFRMELMYQKVYGYSILPAKFTRTSPSLALILTNSASTPNIRRMSALLYTLSRISQTPGAIDSKWQTNDCSPLRSHLSNGE